MFKAVVVAASLTLSAHGDAEWIQQGKFGYCCGVDDCTTTTAVYRNGKYWLPTGESVPEPQALPSVDERYWVCRPDPKAPPRCFFAPRVGL